MTVDMGHDLSCTDDLTETDRVVDGNTIVAEACYRRVTTPRGQLLDDPDYGFDLTMMLDSIGDQRVLAQTLAKIDAEFAKDERVFSSRTTGTLTGNPIAYTLTTSSVITTSDGPFRLVLETSSVSTTILAVT